MIRYTSVVFAGLLLGGIASSAILMRPYLNAFVRKSYSSTGTCSWETLVKQPVTSEQFGSLQRSYEGRLTVMAEDKELGILQIASPTRPFWIKKNGSNMDGKTLLLYILAEEDWIMQNAGGNQVRPGDVVVDVGAHIGTFGDDALRRGASKVVMVEPDPVNLECIRRNFAAEIADGRVILIPEGAWSAEGVIPFHIGTENSGTGTFVGNAGNKSSTVINVRTRRLDDMLQEVGVKTVNFIKMDIEGAEREALKGAARTVATSKPRLMLDAYHRPDDPVVLPAIIHGIRPDYREFCPLCVREGDKFSPYALFFH